MARRPNYRSYIQSQQWYAKHPAWLQRVNYRCGMFPWLRIGKGRPYAIHHMNYRHLGSEVLGRDVIPLSRFAHRHVIHGLLGGFKPAGKQRHFPNLAQRLAHWWCVQRCWFKAVLGIMVLGGGLAGAIFHPSLRCPQEICHNQKLPRDA